MLATKNNIITLPNPRLRKSSQKIGLINQEVQLLIERMKAATLDWEDSREHEVGVALAAIQIGEPYRVIVVRNDFEDKSNREFHIFINPEITKCEGQLVEDYEGCLSIKDIYGRVPRYEKVKVKALDQSGREFRVTAEGFLARVFQHEVDHIKGKLFIDHIKNEPDAFFRLGKDGHLQQIPHSEITAKAHQLFG